MEYLFAQKYFRQDLQDGQDFLIGYGIFHRLGSPAGFVGQVMKDGNSRLRRVSDRMNKINRM